MVGYWCAWRHRLGRRRVLVGYGARSGTASGGGGSWTARGAYGGGAYGGTAYHGTTYYGGTAYPYGAAAAGAAVGAAATTSAYAAYPPPYYRPPCGYYPYPACQ